MKEQLKQKTVPWSNTAVVGIIALLCCFLWGSAFPGIKIGYGIFGIGGDQSGLQIIFAGVRFALAGFLALVIGSISYGRVLLPKKGSFLPILHLCFLQTVIQYFFFYLGLGKTSGVKASIIEALNVFVALFVACVLYKQEKLNRNKIIGSILGFVGVFVVEIWGNTGVESTAGGIGIGELFVFVSTVAYAFSSVYLRRYSKRELPFVLSGYQFLLGGIVLVAVGCIMCFAFPECCGATMEGFSGGMRLLASISLIKNGICSLSGGLIIIYLAMVSAVAYSLWGVLLKYNPVSKVAVYGFTNPIFGVLLSGLLLGEMEQLHMGILALALILVCIGTVMAQKD